MSERDLYNRLFHANRAIDIILADDNAEYPEDAPDYQQTCDTCAILIKPEFYDDHDGLCTQCWNAVHFTCSECGEEFGTDERSETHRRMCEGCGCEAYTEERDAVCDEINELMGDLDGDCDEMAKLKKILTYIKKLSK